MNLLFHAKCVFLREMFYLISVLRGCGANSVPCYSWVLGKLYGKNRTESGMLYTQLHKMGQM